ncbi:MAG: hypothetical protein KC656_30020, partial [Myxococcales bacterium]|nr:hypothetical protein [Myxococcales bacterium]
LVWMLTDANAGPGTSEFSVDGGDLLMAGMTLAARHGGTLGIELTPPTKCVDLVPLPGTRGWTGARTEWKTLAWTYRGGAREGLAGAAEEWARRGGAGDYRVSEANGVIHLIPTTRHAPDGTSVPYASPLDTTVHLSSAKGDVLDLLKEIARAIGTPELPFDVNIDMMQVGPEDFLVDLPSDTGTARDLMDWITVRSGNSWWAVNCVPGLGPTELMPDVASDQVACMLRVFTCRPEDEWWGNAASINPGAPPAPPIRPAPPPTGECAPSPPSRH